VRRHAGRQIRAAGAIQPVDGFDVGKMAFDIPKAIVAFIAAAVDDTVVFKRAIDGAGQGHDW
jgi:hypothetical protein